MTVTSKNMVTIPIEIARRFGVILPRKSVEGLFGYSGLWLWGGFEDQRRFTWLFGSAAGEGSALGWCADLR